MLFDWLVVGQVVPFNPATSVRGPKYVVKKGKTPVLSADEARQLLDAIDTSSIVGLRDRALIALMVYTFARVAGLKQIGGEGLHVEPKVALPSLGLQAEIEIKAVDVGYNPWHVNSLQHLDLFP